MHPHSEGVRTWRGGWPQGVSGALEPDPGVGRRLVEVAVGPVAVVRGDPCHVADVVRLGGGRVSWETGGWLAPQQHGLDGGLADPPAAGPEQADGAVDGVNNPPTGLV